MAAEYERVFSRAKLLISDRRKHLTAPIIKACECLRYWWKTGIISAERKGYTFKDEPLSVGDDEVETEIDDEMNRAIQDSLIDQ